MPGNIVEILVTARDTAKPDLAALRARLDELKTEVATARVSVDDTAAAAKLDDMAAKLAALDKRTANPKIDLAGALRAEAQIHMVEKSLSDLGRKSDQVSSQTGGLTGMIQKLAMALAGGGSSVGGIGGDAGPLSGVSGGLLGALVVIVPAAEALLVELTGLASGFAAAGAGAGAFALLALPAFKKVEQGYQAVNTAQQAYQKALAIQRIDPTTAHATAVKNALDNLKVALTGLDPAQRAAVQSMSALMDTLHRMQKAFEPTAFKVFNDGLQLADKLLPAVLPFAKTFGDVLDGLLKQAGRFAQSQGFKDWLSQFHALEGPALQAIGDGLGKVAIALGNLLTTMSAKDVVNAINIAFTILAGTIDFVAFSVRQLMQSWDSMSSAFRKVRHGIAEDGHFIAHLFDDQRHWTATWAHDIAHDFDSVRHTIASWAHDVANTFDQVRHWIAAKFDQIRQDIRNWINDVLNFFRRLPGDIVHALGNLGGLLVNAGKSLIHGLITGIENAVPGLHSVLSWVGSLIPSWKGPLEKDLVMLRPHGQAIIAGLIGGMQSKLPDLQAQLARTTSTITGGLPRAGVAGAGGYGTAGGRMEVTLRLDGSSGELGRALLNALKGEVRVAGGGGTNSVQRALGQTW